MGQCARRSGADTGSGEFGPDSGQRLLFVSPESAPSERLSKRACAFPMMSSAASVCGQPLVYPGKFAGKSRDFGLFGSQFADLFTKFLTLEYSGIALLTPFADQR